MKTIDEEFEIICSQIQKSRKHEHWRCPKCSTPLTFAFTASQEKRRSAKKASLGVSCGHCGMQMEIDGEFEIPTWYVTGEQG